MSEPEIRICRFCLCKCDNPINMLLDTEITRKTLNIFHKLNLQISPDNGFPIWLCDFCQNTIEQFYTFYEIVAENQEKLAVELEELLNEETETIEFKIEDELDLEEDENEEIWEVLHDDEIETEDSKIVIVNEDSLDSIKKFEQKKQRRSQKVRERRCTMSRDMIKKYKDGAPLDPDLKAKLAKHYNKLYICDYCDYFYTFTKKRMVSHVLECKDTWSLPQKIRESFKTIPSKESLTIPCPLCPPDALKMKNEKILEFHLKEHADYDRIDKERLERGYPPLIPCPKCERRLRNEVEFHSHLKKHENDDLMTCELCGRTTVASNLRSHLRNHFKKIICEFCSKVFKNQSTLLNHINAKHNGPEFFECERCHTKIRREQKFQKHLEMCQGPGTVWPCIHCGETFKSNSNRHYHVKKFHIGYKCKMCGIEVKSVTQLKHHYKSEAHKQRSLKKREELAQNKLIKSDTKKIDTTILKRR
uniref:CSON011839 protein n=1 Tax=Culicoides sonorensis TaxID=179676 RepID=A0A336M813_CULSO